MEITVYSDGSGNTFDSDGGYDEDEEDFELFYGEQDGHNGIFRWI